MLESGDWVVPRLMGEVRTAKPPAIYWLQAAAMRIFGYNEFAVRLSGAVACAATVALLAAGLPALVGRRRAGWACFLFGTSLLVLGVAKVGVIDGVLVLCVAAMQLALLRIAMQRGNHGASIAALWFAVSLGVLVKGPVIVGVLAMTLIAWSVLGGQNRGAGPSLARRLRPVLGACIVLLVCGPWLVLVTLQEPDFLTTSLAHEVGARSISGLEGHGQPPGFHLLALFATWFPWSVVLPATLVAAWRRRRQPRVRLALAACIGPWLMFEVVVTKLPHYLLVIFPMLALITSDWLVRRCALLRTVGLPPWGMKQAAAIFMVVALGFASTPVALAAPSWPATLLALGWGTSVAWSWWTRRLRQGFLLAGVGATAVVSVGYLSWLNHVPILLVSRRTAEALEDVGARDVAMVHYREPSLAWYSLERGILAREAEPAALSGDQHEFAVSTKDAWTRLPVETHSRWQMVARIDGRLYNEHMEFKEILVLQHRNVSRGYTPK